MEKILLVFALCCGCAISPVSTARTALQLCREDGICQCAAMCTQVLPEMSLAKDNGHGLCRCWAMGTPENSAPAATANIKYGSAY